MLENYFRVGQVVCDFMMALKRAYA